MLEPCGFAPLQLGCTKLGERARIGAKLLTFCSLRSAASRIWRRRSETIVVLGSVGGLNPHDRYGAGEVGEVCVLSPDFGAVDERGRSDPRVVYAWLTSGGNGASRKLCIG